MTISTLHSQNKTDLERVRSSLFPNRLSRYWSNPGLPLTGQPFLAALAQVKVGKEAPRRVAISGNVIPQYPLQGQGQTHSELEAGAAEAGTAGSYELIADQARLEELCQIGGEIATAPLLALDTETTGLDPFTAHLLLVQLALPDGRCFVLDATKLTSLVPLKPILENPGQLKLLQNAKFDYEVLKVQAGIELANIYDTFLAERILTCGQSGQQMELGLAALAKKYTAYRLDKSVRPSFYLNEQGGGIGDGTIGDQAQFRFQSVIMSRLTEEQLDYAARDVLVLFPIFQRQMRRLQEDDLLGVAHLECACVPAVADMELAGCKLDVVRWRQVLEEAAGKREAVKAEIMRLLGVEPRPTQLALPGFDVVALAGRKAERGAEQDPHPDDNLSPAGSATVPTTPPTPTPTPPTVTNYSLNLNSSSQVLEAFGRVGINYLRSTNERELGRYELRHPVIGLLIEYRGYEKMLSAFGENILKRVHPRTGRIHPDFLQIGADTGRFSCTSPNLQQIPANSDFRKCFVAEPGYKLVVADYRQAELAILAVVAGDEGLLSAFQEKKDLHRLAAATMFGLSSVEEVTTKQRAAGKALNFGLAYGMSAGGLASALGKTVGEAEKLMRSYFKAFPRIEGWLEGIGQFAIEYGYSLTPLGRRRYYNKLSPEELGQEDYEKRLVRISRRAKSTAMQGGNADITKLALILLRERFRAEGLAVSTAARVVNTVHDEIVVEAREDVAEVVRVMVEQEMARAGELLLGQAGVLAAEAVVADCWSK